MVLAWEPILRVSKLSLDYIDTAGGEVLLEFPFVVGFGEDPAVEGIGTESFEGWGSFREVEETEEVEIANCLDQNVVRECPEIRLGSHCQWLQRLVHQPAIRHRLVDTRVAESNIPPSTLTSQYLYKATK